MRRLRFSLGWLLLFSPVLSADITGKVTVTPRNVQTPVMISPYSRNRYAPPRPHAQSMDKPTVVLYLKAHPALLRSERNDKPVIIDQLDIASVPHLTILEVGS